jgi:effector-binding domain-containing protein
MISGPKIEHRPAHPYAAVRLQVPIPFGKYLQPAWSKVHKWLAGQGIPSGPAIIRYLTTDMSAKLDMDVGFVMDRAVPGNHDILVDVLPAGQYATLLYTGPYKGKGVFKANVAMIEWAKENAVAWKISKREGVEWWEARVEWYLSDPDSALDPKQYQTELAFMVAGGG